MWNLEKWFRWTYLLGRDRDTEGENRWVHGGREGVGWIGRLELVYVHCRMWDRQLVGNCSVAQGAQLGAPWWAGGVGWLGRGRPKRGGICMHVADLLCCTAETSTIVQRNYTPVKKKSMTRTSLLTRQPWIFSDENNSMCLCVVSSLSLWYFSFWKPGWWNSYYLEHCYWQFLMGKESVKLSSGS